MTATTADRIPHRRRWWRPGRDRATGYAAVGIVGVLVAAALVLGGGAATPISRLADIGGWLGNSSNGTVVHVNGLTGGVDGWVRLDGSGHPLKISQSPDGVLVVDQTTGLVSRIDPAQVTVAQAQNFGQTGLEVFDDGKTAYLVNADAGTIQLIDTSTLSLRGSALSLAAPLGHAGQDANSTLWVPLANGSVVPVTAGADATPVAGTPVKVGDPNDPLTLTVAAGTPVVTDARSGAVTVLSASGGQLSVKLPPDAVPPTGGQVVAPDTADSAVVPVLAKGDGTLVLVDTAHGSLSAVHIDAGQDELGAPQTLGGKVYIPDDTKGTLIVYDTASGSFQTQITVTGHAGQLIAQVRDGLLWVDDQAGQQALVIGSDGVPHVVNKAAPGGPAASTSAQAGVAVTPSAKPSEQKKSDSASSADNPSSSAPDKHHSHTPPGPGPAKTSQITAVATPSSAVLPTGSPSGSTSSSAPAPSTPPSTPSTSKSKPTPSTPSSTSSSSSPSPSTSSSTPAPASAPGTPTATSGPGYITVTFPPVANGATPTGYVLQGAPAGATIAPSQVPASGPYSFRVTGGTCSATYSFTVAAVYPGGNKASTPSVAVRPCTVPTTPTGFSGTAVNHGANLKWNASNGNGGTPTYSISGPGSVRITGTTASVGNLTNFTTATFLLTATTAAGTSNPAASTQVAINGPIYGATAWNDSAGGFNVRDAPNTLHAPIGSYPQGSRAAITVICQDPHGEIIKDRTVWSGASYIWDKVQYQGGTAWIAGIYVSTPNVRAGRYTTPDSNIWPCS